MRKVSFLIVSLIFSSFLLITPSDVFADMIYLKNGKQIEGLIVAEDSESVKINIGSGKITLQKKNISRILKYTPQEQANLEKKLKYKYFWQPEFVPEELKVLVTHFQKIEDLRAIAVAAKKKKDAVIEKIEKHDSALTILSKKTIKLSKELIAFSVTDEPEKYNILIKEFNSLRAQTELNEHEKATLTKQIISLDKEISEYVSELNLFRKEFVQGSEEEITLESRGLIDILRKKIKAMDSDFVSHSIDYNFSGFGITVKVLLNNLIVANLVLDTGATIVMLSKETAVRLNLNLDKKSFSTYVTLADGRKAKARITLLESIKVGELEAKNVEVAILEHSEDISTDGLLGMAFLKNFTLKIDPKGKRIILEEFNP